MRADSNHMMIELKKLVPEVQYDMRYATNNNFTGHILYTSSNITFLRLPVAKALQKVEKEFQQQGYGIKLYDAYRPFSVTKEMWDLIRDERYVANPAKGSGHNRGLAIDLTLIDLRTGQELNMGTGYDNFTDTAHHSFTNLPDFVLNNRKLLRSIMEKHGFKAMETEWWHYSWPNDRNYDVLDIDFRKLDELSR